MTIPEEDQKLDAELRALLSRVAFLTSDLYRTRPGCTCDEKILCAHHMAIKRNLGQIMTNLERAMDKIELEG